MPVMEEVLQVQRVWVLKEEVHIRRTTTVETHEEKLVVSREEALVERIDPSGNAIPTSPEPASEPLEPPLADAAPEPDARLKPISILEKTGPERGGSRSAIDPRTSVKPPKAVVQVVLANRMILRAEDYDSADWKTR